MSFRANAQELKIRRTHVLNCFADGSMTAKDIAETLSITPSVVSKDLAILRDMKKIDFVTPLTKPPQYTLIKKSESEIVLNTCLACDNADKIEMLSSRLTADITTYCQDNSLNRIQFIEDILQKTMDNLPIKSLDQFTKDDPEKTEDLSLFTPPPKKQIKQFGTKSIIYRLYNFLKTHPDDDYTTKELAKILNVNFNSTGPRLSELRKLGYIRFLPFCKTFTFTSGIPRVEKRIIVIMKQKKQITRQELADTIPINSLLLAFPLNLLIQQGIIKYLKNQTYLYISPPKINIWTKITNFFS